MLGSIRVYSEHIFIQDIGAQDARLVLTLDLHRGVRAAEDQALLASLQFSPEILFGNRTRIDLA